MTDTSPVAYNPDGNGQARPSPPETPMEKEYRRRLIDPGIRDGSVIPILPRHGIYLFEPGRKGERFADLFRATWGRIPLGPRRLMIRHWKRWPTWLAYGIGPAVELLPGWSGRCGRGLKGDKAACCQRGHLLRFHSGIVRRYPDPLVMDLIAHELAHVHQWASGWDLNLEEPCVYEDDADWTAESWGFSSTAIDDFDRAAGISKVIDVDAMSPEDARRARERHFARVIKNGR